MAVSYERLSSQDATLLCAETLAAPLQIGALCLFEAGPLTGPDGHLRLQDLRRHIESRLRQTHRFRQKLQPVPYEQGPPVWVDDPSFDIAHHVRVAVLPRPGGPAQLRTFMARLLETPLDRRLPLWELWFVEGIEGDRVAVVPKVNHVMADGMAVLEFALSVLDPETRTDVETPLVWQPEAPPPAIRLLWDALVDRAWRPVAIARRSLAAFRDDPARVFADIWAVAGAVQSTAELAPRLAITRPVGARRDFAWLRLPFDDVRDVARGRHATVNDVVLAIVSRALARYLEAGDTPAGVRPRVLVPVSTHRGPGEVENRFSMIVANLGPDVVDPVSQVDVVHAEMKARKTSGQARLGPLLFTLGDLVSPRLLRAVAGVALKRQPFVNLVVTNLPGTEDLVYLLGARLLELFPFVTVTGNIAVIIGVLSYHGTLGVGVTVDPDVVDDVDRFVDAIRSAAYELVARDVRR